MSNQSSFGLCQPRGQCTRCQGPGALWPGSPVHTDSFGNLHCASWNGLLDAVAHSILGDVPHGAQIPLPRQGTRLESHISAAMSSGSYKEAEAGFLLPETCRPSQGISLRKATLLAFSNHFVSFTFPLPSSPSFGTSIFSDRLLFEKVSAHSSAFPSHHPDSLEHCTVLQ